MIEAPTESYPLTWPDGHPRTPAAERQPGHAFKLTFGVYMRELQDEVGRLGGVDLIVSTNIRSKPNGMPYATERPPSDPGVAVYFTWNGKPYAMACDRYTEVRKNIRGITLCIDALRALERHGSSAILERAFRGFTALPAHASRPGWADVLGVPSTATAADIDTAFRRLALEAHPDKPGGSHEAMARLTEARADGLACVAAAAAAP